MLTLSLDILRFLVFELGIIHFKVYFWGGREIIQWVKAPAATSQGPECILLNHMVEEENHLLHVVL